MWPGEETGGIWTLAFSVCLCDSSAPTGVGYQGKILIQTDHSSMLGVPSGHSLKRDARQAGAGSGSDGWCSAQWRVDCGEPRVALAARVMVFCQGRAGSSSIGRKAAFDVAWDQDRVDDVDDAFRMGEVAFHDSCQPAFLIRDLQCVSDNPDTQRGSGYRAQGRTPPPVANGLLQFFRRDLARHQMVGQNGLQPFPVLGKKEHVEVAPGFRTGR